jgi:DNA-3-methyladenine glycosylase II
MAAVGNKRKSSQPPPDWSEATAYLCKVEPRFRAFVERAGPCTLSPRRDYFHALCGSIVSQQISTAAARTVMARFRALFPRQVPTPEALLELSTDTLREAGIGPQRQSYLRALAQAHVDGTLPKTGWHRMTDDEVLHRLTKVKGIGHWTAEMFLMFVLCRPDVLPVDDLGLQVGAAKLINHSEKKLTPKQIHALGEPWRPYRTIASWYLWKGRPV